MVSVQAVAVDIPGEPNACHSETLIVVRVPYLCPRDERFFVDALGAVARAMICMAEAADKK